MVDAFSGFTFQTVEAHIVREAAPEARRKRLQTEAEAAAEREKSAKKRKRKP